MKTKFIQILVSEFPIPVPPGYTSIYGGQWEESAAPKDWPAHWVYMKDENPYSLIVDGKVVSDVELIERLKREGIVLTLEHRHPSAKKYGAPLDAVGHKEFAAALLRELGWLQSDIDLSHITCDNGGSEVSVYFIHVAVPPVLEEWLAVRLQHIPESDVTV